MSITVNGVEIKEDAVIKEFERLLPEYEVYVEKNEGVVDEAQLKEWALENLIEVELLRQEAERTQSEPSANKIKLYMDEFSADLSDEITDEEKRAMCVRDIKVRGLIKSVRKNVQRPSEEQLREEYNSNIELFTVPEALKLAHICRVPSALQDKAQAFIDLMELKKKIESSEIHWMDALSSSDTFNDDNGLFDTIFRGMFPAEIEEKLFALKRFEISDVIELEEYGSLHIFRMLIKRDAELLPFEDVRDDITNRLFDEAAEEALNGLIDQLKSNAEIVRA